MVWFSLRNEVLLLATLMLSFGVFNFFIVGIAEHDLKRHCVLDMPLPFIVITAVINLACGSLAYFVALKSHIVSSYALFGLSLVNLVFAIIGFCFVISSLSIIFLLYSAYYVHLMWSLKEALRLQLPIDGSSPPYHDQVQQPLLPEL
jgi:hypothetical protein